MLLLVISQSMGWDGIIVAIVSLLQNDGWDQNWCFSLITISKQQAGWPSTPPSIHLDRLQQCNPPAKIIYCNCAAAVDFVHVHERRGASTAIWHWMNWSAFESRKAVQVRHSHQKFITFIPFTAGRWADHAPIQPTNLNESIDDSHSQAYIIIILLSLL